MEEVLDILATETGRLYAAILLLAVVSGLALALGLAAVIRSSRIVARFRRLLEGGTGNLEEHLLRQAEGMDALAERLGGVEARHAELGSKLARCLQRLGVVRYNAFEDVGSDLSFAIALLDSGSNGVVISSLYGREESRVFAKPVVAGDSPYPLSEEEREAIRRAEGASVEGRWRRRSQREATAPRRGMV